MAESSPSLVLTRDRGRVQSSAMAWLLLLTAVVHVPSLLNPFFIDDYVYLETVQKISMSDIPGVFATATMDEDASGVWWTPKGLLPFYRPIAILSFAVEYQIWGMNAFGFHLTNLLCHLLSTFLVWRLGLRLLKDDRWAVAAAAIFAFHPIHMEAVLWISGRFDLLVCVCVLGAALSYLNFRQAGGGRYRWGVLCLVLFAIGLGCKETALILPAVLVLLECLRWRGDRDARLTRSTLVLGLGLGVVSVVYLAQRFRIFGGLGSLPPPYGVDLSSASAVGQILWNISQYLLDFVLLIQIDAIYINGFWERNPWLLYLLAGLAVLILMGAWRLASGRRVFRVGVVWAVLFTLPALMAMPGERNVYLSSVGTSLMGAVVLAAFWSRAGHRADARRRLWQVAAAVLGLFVVIAGVKQLVGARVGWAANQVYVDLMAAEPDPPRDARILIINQCPLNAVGFTQGVHLLYDRDDVTAFALGVSPQFEGVTRDTLYRTGDSTVRMVRQNGVFFKTFLERFLLFNKPASVLPDSASRVGLKIIDPPKNFDDVTELQLGLGVSLDDPRLMLFEWDNSGVSSMLDLISRANWPRLVRYHPQDVRSIPSRN